MLRVQEKLQLVRGEEGQKAAGLDLDCREVESRGRGAEEALRSGSEATGPGADIVGLDGITVDAGAQFVPNHWDL